MLVGIHPCVSPELLYALARMGHGDEIAVVDAYYPGHSNNDLVIRCDGSTAAELLAGVLPLLCLDDYVAAPVAMMRPEAHDRCDPELERDFRAAIDRCWPDTPAIARIGRQEFLARSRAAFAIVVTGERRKYGNILLRKGVPGQQ
nr:RbsD/FucU domain-containing protein [uncultured Janthinobacterium sp.]